jgi:hypothetical protein
MTPQQQHDAVCKQAQQLNKNLGAARIASTVVGAAGGACIAATAGGCAIPGAIGVATGVFGNIVFGGTELINGAIANIGLEGKWGDMIHIHLNFNCSAVEFRLPVCGGMEAPGPSQVSS